MADDRRLDRIEAKIDDVSSHLGSIDSTLSAQHVSLQEHMRRTNILEAKLEPVEKHVAMVNGAFKLITMIGIIVGIIAAIKALR